VVASITPLEKKPDPTANSAPINVTIQPSTPITLSVSLPELAPNKSFDVKRTDGAALPAWVKFDSATGTFSGTPPAGFNESFEVVINAPQADGSTKTVTVKFELPNVN
jgi:hypothetical protein